MALVTHDWGVLVGLRWACDHPDSVRSLTISDGGFFADRRWHDLANVMRTPGEGEGLLASYTREAFDAGMRQLCTGIDDEALGEYWKAFADDTRRHGPPRAVPLRGLREARPLRGPPRRARAADADPVGRGGSVRERADGRALPPRDPRLGAARDRGRGALRVGGRARALHEGIWWSSCSATPDGVLEVTEYTDPGCPWAYSASPALAVLQWRYRDQLRWRIVAIGLTEDPQRYIDAGYTPARVSAGVLCFRRYGMPFAPAPRPRVAATSRACRAIVATRLLDPPREREVLRALQFAWFTTPLQLDEDEDIGRALSVLDGLDVQAIVGAIDDAATLEAYEQDRRETRTAEGGATDYQGKARQTDGPVRYSAPSLVFESEAGVRVEAGGFQPVEAYDVLIANLDRSLERHPPPGRRRWRRWRSSRPDW